MMIIIQFLNCALPLVLKITRQFVKHTLGRKIKHTRRSTVGEKYYTDIFKNIHFDVRRKFNDKVKLNNYCNGS